VLHSVFLPVNAIMRWLYNVSGVYLIHVSLLLIGQQGLVDFFTYRPLLPIGWRIVQILRQHRRKRPIQRQPLLVHTAKTKCRKFDTNIPRKGISGPQSQFPHSCVCERFIFSQVRSTYFFQQKRQPHRGNI